MKKNPDTGMTPQEERANPMLAAVRAVHRRREAERAAASLRVHESENTIGPRDFTCPACNAKPGEPCTAPTNTSRRAVTWFHTAREDEARRD